MRSLKVADLPKFMNLLFATDTFDNLFVSEASVETFATFKIDGYTNKDFFDDSDSAYDTYAAWSKLRPILREMIKGKKIPLSIRITFVIPAALLNDLIPNLDMTGRIPTNFLFNVRYEKNTLHLISAVFVTAFSLDREPEKLWDDAFKKYISSLAISFDEE